MRSSRFAVGAGLVVLGAFAIAGTARAQPTTDVLVGTWHLNVAKSKYSPGPAPKSITLTVQETAQGTKSTADIVLADGQKRQTEFTAKDDGKDYPLTGSPVADTVSVKMDGNTRIRTDKKGGKVVMTYTGKVSADGKTFTVQQKGTDEKGQAVNNTVVFEKQ